MINEVDRHSSLSVGNGNFTFTADITGLQTFPEYYERGIPLGTMADWAWHSFPNPDSFNLADVVKYYKTGNDSVPYWYQFGNEGTMREREATKWLRENPHRFHLSLIGLEILKSDSLSLDISDIQNPEQQLNLWTGELISKFKVESIPVQITTLCHQEQDLISVRIQSKFVSSGRLSIRIHFLYPAHDKYNPGYVPGNADLHQTHYVTDSSGRVSFTRILDSTRYFSRIAWADSANLTLRDKHTFLVQPVSKKGSFEFSMAFSREAVNKELPGFNDTRENNSKNWKNFWEHGGAVDFSGSTDPRANELERRVVLAQYLTKIQCTGKYPPQETGLTYNSWHGKFHLEMHWWHALHFLLWNRSELIEQQFEYYNAIFNQAMNTAEFQGYEGVRWPKMVGPEGRESPSSIGTFLIWQQPHLIYYAEQLYQQHPDKQAILEQYKKRIVATANFMASYPQWDSINKRYVLGPALIPAQERFHPETTINPTFELAYWHWGLNTAQKWLKRLG